MTLREFPSCSMSCLMSLCSNVVGGIDNLRWEMMKRERRRLERRESANHFSGDKRASIFATNLLWTSLDQMTTNENPQSIAVLKQCPKELCSDFK
jgi:hypothetical protein